MCGRCAFNMPRFTRPSLKREPRRVVGALGLLRMTSARIYDVKKRTLTSVRVRVCPIGGRSTRQNTSHLIAHARTGKPSYNCLLSPRTVRGEKEKGSTGSEGFGEKNRFQISDLVHESRTPHKNSAPTGRSDSPYGTSKTPWPASGMTTHLFLDNVACSSALRLSLRLRLCLRLRLRLRPRPPRADAPSFTQKKYLKKSQ